MKVPVKMPVITEAGAEAVVTAWFVDEGGPVEEGRLIAEVQAEKVADEVHAPASGQVVDLVPINQPVPQGDPICTIVTDVAATEAAPASSPPTGTAATAPSAEGRVLASPAARRLARELGVDLATVTGTGPGGRVTEADVRQAAGQVTEGAPVTSEPEQAGGEPLTGVRATIARNLRRSHLESAHVTISRTVDVTDVPTEGFTARVLLACAAALEQHPSLSGTREGDRFFPAPEPVLCVAVDTDRGLLAPVVGDVRGMTIEEVARRIEEVADRARSADLEAADLTGGSFTVTNLGPWGVEVFTPLINHPQVAILGVGAIRDTVGFDAQGRPERRRGVVLSLTFDHAFIDGVPAARFLADVAAALPR